MPATNKKKTKARKSQTAGNNETSPSSVDNSILTLLLGPNLLKTTNGKTVAIPTTKILKDKEFVALYFAAQWSCHSTAFTPKLVEFYEKASSLEVVLVSSDSTEEESDQQFQTMPWAAMESETPEHVRRKTDLIPLFKAFRIPNLILLHVPTGQFVTAQGRADVLSAVLDQDGKKEVEDVLQKWKDTPRSEVENAHIDYGGIMTLVKYLAKNPHYIAIIALILVVTPLGQKIMEKPLLLVGFYLLIQRWTTPTGDRNIARIYMSAKKEMESKKTD